MAGLEQGIARKAALNSSRPCWEVRSRRDLTKMNQKPSVRDVKWGTVRERRESRRKKGGGESTRQEACLGFCFVLF